MACAFAAATSSSSSAAAAPSAQPKKRPRDPRELAQLSIEFMQDTGMDLGLYVRRSRASISAVV